MTYDGQILNIEDFEVQTYVTLLRTIALIPAVLHWRFIFARRNDGFDVRPDRRKYIDAFGDYVVVSAQT
jgi:hypothetical protein